MYSDTALKGSNDFAQCTVVITITYCFFKDNDFRAKAILGIAACYSIALVKLLCCKIKERGKNMKIFITLLKISNMK